MIRHTIISMPPNIFREAANPRREGKPVRYLSVCAGIEAASVAWEPLGYQAVAYSEIEPYPSAVLARRYPDVPNMGDMTKYETWNLSSKIDLLVGGTPCQSFSVAGKRGSLEDERGNLCLTYCRMADYYDPEWVIWENVPGVLNTVDNAFGCLLGKLCGFGAPIPPARGRRHEPCGVVAGPKRTVAWRVMDAQWHGVPQRRRRVFVVASRGAGNWAAADALLPIGESMPRNLEEIRKERQKAAARAGAGAAGSHWEGGPHPTLGAIASGVGMSDQELFGQRGAYLVRDVSPTVTSKWAKGAGGNPFERQNLVIQLRPQAESILYENHPQDSRVTGPCTISPACTAQWGTGGGNTPLVLQEGLPTARSGNMKQSALCMPIDMRSVCRSDDKQGARDGLGDCGAPSYTLTAQGHVPGVCYVIQGDIADGRRLSQNGLGIAQDVSYTLATSSPPAVSWSGAVRRLTPVECERLQGFPDGWTLIEKSPGKYYGDSHRYKALGNSMAVPVMRWLGRRILTVTASNLRSGDERECA